MIVLFTIPILCSDINQALTNTTIEDKSESFVRTRNKGFNEKHESFEKKGQKGQLSESSTTEEGGEKETGKENYRTERTRADDAQIDKAKSNDKVNVKVVNSDPRKHNFKVSTKAIDIKVDKTGIFHFKPSGIGNSWLIGTDVNSDGASNRANAYTNGISGCPYNLIIPSSLTDDDGHTKKVEIIGNYAFHACADKRYNGQTRKLTLTKQVKVIKYKGLGYMYYLEEFVLEGGSVLETIETGGMRDIGYDAGKTESNRVTLTLPSTLSSVFEDGIYYCNFFHTIIYCGSHTLSNYSDLEWSVSKDTVVKVSSQYPSDKNIFGRSPDRNSQAEVEESCSKMEVRPILKPSYNCSFASHSNCFLSFFATLLPSQSLSSKSFSSQALFLKLI